MSLDKAPNNHKLIALAASPVHVVVMNLFVRARL